MIPGNAPQWLKDADTWNADVELVNGEVVWRGGEFSGGVFRGDVFRGGVFSGGVFSGGEFSGGEFRDGEFSGGVFSGGVFSGGEFRGGEFRGGEWRDERYERVPYMLAMLGIVPECDGTLIGYRSTAADGCGRYTKNWSQPIGEYYETDLPPAGLGTCVKGIHVSSAAVAWTCFGIDPTAQLWRVKFQLADVLDCDGTKARIRGGHFERMAWPFVRPAERAALVEIGGKTE